MTSRQQEFVHLVALKIHSDARLKKLQREYRDAVVSTLVPLPNVGALRTAIDQERERFADLCKRIQGFNQPVTGSGQQPVVQNVGKDIPDEHGGPPTAA